MSPRIAVKISARGQPGIHTIAVLVQVIGNDIGDNNNFRWL